MKDKEKWDIIVKSFSNWDIYYLYDYAYSFMLHGDGEPLLVEYQDENSHFCYVVMKSDISDFHKFNGYIKKGVWFDLETPYGYGGPLCEGSISKESQTTFMNEMKEYCNSQGIVSQFLRFHPLLENHDALSLVFETRYLRDTIYIDTQSPELIMANMDSKNRNMVRKAIKSGVTIKQMPIEDYADFLIMYEETMRKDAASDYYFFKKDYFEAQKALGNYACFFYAMYEERPIAGSIIYYNDRFAHYHLAGTHTEYRKYSPSNLLLYEVACWASKIGIKKFHLGGGMAPEDSLFGFKKQFNKHGRLPFVVGRTIFDEERYKQLLVIRKEKDMSFNIDNNRMIQYRCE